MLLPVTSCVYTITKKRVARYEIFCELPLLSVSIRIYLQVCTRYACSTLYEKVFRANEGSTLGKIFRSRDHVARFPNLEDHVQSTCPFGRVLVSQHPITCSTNDLILSFLAFFDQRICSKRELRSLSKDYSSNFVQLSTWVVRFKSESDRAEFRHDHGVLGNRAVEIP